MPVVSITLDDTNRSILSNVYYKIIQDIVDRIKIPYGTLVILHKDTEVTLTDNKTNVSIQDKPNLPSTVSRRRIQVTINEEYNEDELTTTAVHQQSASPIFLDMDINVSAYPVYVKSDISIEFNYITPSKIEANRLRDDIRLRLSQTRNIDIHEVEYDILIPEVVEDFISDIYDLKNRLLPQSLEEYFKKHSTPRIYPITDMSNATNTKLAIKEKQVRILGLFDFNSMPEKLEIDNENNNYKFSFTYKLSLEVPRAIALSYPVMVCNRLLPSKYISFLEEHKLNTKEELNKIEGYTSNAIYNLSTFEAHRQLEYKTDINLPVNVPIFDEFSLRQGHSGYAIIASFLTDVNEDNKKSLFNLKDIEPYELPDFLLDYIIESELPHIIQPYSSFLYLGLYQQDKFFDADILTIDNQLNISSRKELSLFKPVRVTLSYCVDLSMLNPKALERLKNKPEILVFLLKEYLSVVNNFKTEVRHTINDNSFYRYFIDLILYFHNKGYLDIVCALIKVIDNDRYTNNQFSTILYTGFNDLYKRLLKDGVIHIDPRNYELTRLCGLDYQEKIFKESDYQPKLITNFNISDSRHKVERGIIQTVMNASVIAYRK